MKLIQLLIEADIAAALAANTQQQRLTATAWRHDVTVPRELRAQLGHKPSDSDIVSLLANKIQQRLTTSAWGDLSRNSAVVKWIATAYANGMVDYEDLMGEALERLAEHQLLLRRGILTVPQRNLAAYDTVADLGAVIHQYQDDIKRLRNQAEIDRHRRTKQDITLIDNDEYLVTVPFNYGACYTFNNTQGVQANFCTGGSGGLEWFQHYAPIGMIIMVLDKQHSDSVDGKWQIHNVTRQLVNARQERRGNREVNDQRFAQLFPGLMRAIGQAIVDHSVELNSAIAAAGWHYTAEQEVQKLHQQWPISWSSQPQ